MPPQQEIPSASAIQHLSIIFPEQESNILADLQPLFRLSHHYISYNFAKMPEQHPKGLFQKAASREEFLAAPYEGYTRRSSFEEGLSGVCDMAEQEAPPEEYVFNDDVYGPPEIMRLPDPKDYQKYEGILSSLSGFDITILLDNSSSMRDPASSKPKEFTRSSQWHEPARAKSEESTRPTRWRHAMKLLIAIAGFVTKYDNDGIDIHFLNGDPREKRNISTTEEIYSLLNEVTVQGGTPTGRRLRDVLEGYWDARGFRKAILGIQKAKNKAEKKRKGWSRTFRSESIEKKLESELERIMTKLAQRKEGKKLFILLITDGEEDYPEKRETEKVIVEYAKELDLLQRPEREVVIQLCQIGVLQDVGQREKLNEYLDGLDNCLKDSDKYGIKRDMVDRVPFGETYDSTTHELSIFKDFDKAKVSDINPVLQEYAER
ncbi:hypothetical protein BJ508DRAFT_415957 [Ascobolus immersus RN42]|uniref:VWFA domain-containing protein n=1 Tax=Ascobolus immersus RN42 TaxID=1160509 RepID=A0A3N4I1P8_ASCIM|nr:hypothetical protein BJ508DRAFT_415957 [Ascobolus immersus RN42]